MNKEVKELIEEIKEYRDGFSNVLAPTEESVKALLDYINQLETNRDELKKWLEEEKNKHYDRKWLSDDELCYRLEDNSAKTIIAVQTKIDELERGKEC